MAAASPKLADLTGREECRGCNGHFVKILRHLASSTSCRAFYDYEKEKEDRRKETLKSSRSKSREKLTEEQKRTINEEKKTYMRKKREALTEEEKQIFNEDMKKYMQKKREGLSEEEKDVIREKDRIAHQKRYDQLKNDPLFKETLRQKQERYRKNLYGDENKTRRGRKRLFNRWNKYGLLFPCCTCEGKFFEEQVVEVGVIEEFRDKLNGVFPNLFEEAVNNNIEDIPKCRTAWEEHNGKYFLCTSCKKYLFQGKMPPKSNMNNLKSPDLEKMPELQLSELELSLLARTLVFMKIFNLPKSQMTAVKDRTVCVPIDHETMMKTLKSLPRTPKEALLVPVQLKRKKGMKNSHLQELINPVKVFKAAKTLKNQGHPYYQEIEDSDLDSYLEKYFEELNIEEEDEDEDEEIFSCETCGKSFDTEFKLKVHERKSHLSESKKAEKRCRQIEAEDFEGMEEDLNLSEASEDEGIRAKKKFKGNDSEHEEVLIPYGGVEEMENPDGEETEDLIVLYKKNLESKKVETFSLVSEDQFTDEVDDEDFDEDTVE